jgi:hypothetical protein
MNGVDFTPEQLAEGRQTALTALAAIVSDDPRDSAMAADVTRGADAATTVAGMCALLVEALTEHGEDVAAWAARKQDETALAGG